MNLEAILTDGARFYTGNGEEVVEVFNNFDWGVLARIILNADGNPVYDGDFFHYRWEELSITEDDIIPSEEF